MTEPAVVDLALANLVASLADNKYFLGRRYAEWCTAAPALESAVAAASMAQDEIGHARSLYPVLRDISGNSPQNEPETRTSWTAIPFLREPFAEWTDFVATNAIFDAAMTVLLESAANSSLKALSQRARRIIEEEALHQLHAEGWIRKLAATGGGVKSAFQRSIDIVAPQTFEWLSIATADLVSGGILEEGTTELRATLSERLNPQLVESGLDHVP